VKKIHFLSNMILQPIGRELRRDFECSYADLDTVVATLNSKIDCDYLLLLLDGRFFYDFKPSNRVQNVAFLKELLKEFRKHNSATILLGNIDEPEIYSIDSKSLRLEQKALLDLNLEIEEFKSEISDLEIIDIFSIALKYGHQTIYNRKNRYLFQSPFTKKGSQIVAKEIKDAIKRCEAKRKKVIVVDGDNTLWGGIVGEDGIDGVLCDENYPGIGYKRFQQLLLEIKQSGIVLALVSKNNYEDIKELFENRSMPLKLDDFISTRVNWLPKSQNIKDIADELNLGLDSFLFIDDNPFEIDEVKSAIPQISTLQADKDNPFNTIDELLSRADIQAILITNEDREKSKQYILEKKRAEVFKESASIEDFIKGLNIKIRYWIDNLSQLKRVTQLINKTNQFNLTTRRYKESEVEQMMRSSEYKVFSFRVEDRFGDMGIVGVVIVKDTHIDTFLLSCRVLGRGIEDRIMDIVLSEADIASSEYIPSSKNSQVETLYERLGFEVKEQKSDGSKIYKFISKEPKQEYIEIIKGEL